MSNKVISVFADVNNLYHGAFKKYRGRLNFKLFLEKLIKDYGRIQVAYAYGIANADDKKIGPFRTLLRHVGFECRWADAQYNWNVGIAMDVVRQLDKVDLIILASGDPYLAPCAEYVKNQGILCYTYGFQISDEMKKACDRYFEIPENLMVVPNASTSVP